MKLAAAISPALTPVAAPGTPCTFRLSGNDTLEALLWRKSKAGEKEVAEWHNVITSTDHDDVAAQ